MKLIDTGDAEVWTVTEREGPQRRPHELFPDYDPALGDHLLARMPHSVFAPATGRMFHTYQSFVLRRNGQVIVIDTCVGDQKARPPHFNFPKHDWPATLARAGFAVEDVDHVICTHLHVDHVGWNTTLSEQREWVPTFPNATYWFGAEDCEYWESRMKAGDDLAGRIWTDSVLPLIASGKATMVPMDYTFGDGITFVPAPGHTPGMFRVDVSLDKGKLVFASDIMHNPLQCRMPAWSTVFCTDRQKAAETRTRFLEEVADSGTVVFPEHFAYPVAGRLIRDGDGYAYQYLDGRVL